MREWIETNGLGGYASLTQREETQRKFHGLLISSLHPPADRWIFISNLLDELVIDETNILLKDYGIFSFDFFPTWTYNTPYGLIKKTLFMPHDQNTTVLKYDVSLQKKAQINHHLNVTSRHFYDVYDRPERFSYEYNTQPHTLEFKPHNVDANVLIHIPNAEFNPINQWKPQTYDLDCQRNDTCFDHHLYLGWFKKHISFNQSYYLFFSTEQTRYPDLNQLFSMETQRRRNILENAHLPCEMNRLILASDRFIVKKPPYHTIIAGYHWFSDWGRDTLIALPGITLVPGRFDIAKEILEGLATYTRQGIIPNTFDDRDSSPAYNTVDASLWYIDRVFQYLKYSNDTSFLNTYYPVFQSIIEAYQRGTHHHIFMDDDYLISHDPGLTWMDVKLGEYYPTPRARKAVEIQALWYNALRIMSLFAELTNNENPYESLAEQVKKSFNTNYTRLYDVIDSKDITIRPNMIFLTSLDHIMIPKTTQQQIVDLVEKKLLTIFGLRTLDPDDPQYKSAYIGPYHRDLAYHNGTVWPWLLGSFIKAKTKLQRNNDAWKSKAFESYLSTLLHIYGDKWDGSIHEIFDAEPPFAPRGCISQAWSVAELMRAWAEDINGKRPPYEHVFVSNEVRI
jgi:predicted glycogen debranching enzyme